MDDSIKDVLHTENIDFLEGAVPVPPGAEGFSSKLSENTLGGGQTTRSANRPSVLSPEAMQAGQLHDDARLDRVRVLLAEETNLKLTNQEENINVVDSLVELKRAELTDSEVIRCNNKILDGPSSNYFDEHGFVIVNHLNPPVSFDEIWTGEKDHFIERISSKVKKRVATALKKGGSIEAAQASLPDLVVQKPLRTETAEIYQAGNGVKIVIMREDAKEVDPRLVSQTVAGVDASLRKMKLTESLDGFIILLSPQLPMSLSHQSPEDKIIVLGTYGIDPEQSQDAMHVLAHEMGHAKYQKTIQEQNGIYVAGVDRNSVLEPSLYFYNEGIAEFAGLEAAGLSPKEELKRLQDLMYPQAKTELKNGTLQGDYDGDKIWKWIKQSKSPRIAASIHSRVLPAALIQFCAEKEITLQQLMQVQLDSAQGGINELAVAQEVDPSLLSIDSNSTWLAINRLGKETSFTEINAVYHKYCLQPFEMVAKALNVGTKDAANLFNKWLQEAA